MTKSLAQVAYDAAWPEDAPDAWTRERAIFKKRWEAAAQAVRAAVLEEAAKVCEERLKIDGLHSNFICAQQIRSLK